MKTNYQTALDAIDVSDETFTTLKKASLEKSDNFNLIWGVLNTPYIESNARNRLALVNALLQDGHQEDQLVELFCTLIDDYQYKFNQGEMHDFDELIQGKFVYLPRNSKLKIAFAFEMSFAHGNNIKELLSSIYQKITDNVTYYDETDILVKAAKLAYSTHINNWKQRVETIWGIKTHLKRSDNDCEKHKVSYYLGLAYLFSDQRYERSTGLDLIQKAGRHDFMLAKVYLDYNQI